MLPHQYRTDLLAAKLIFSANEVARRWNDNVIGSDHLLLATYDLRDGATIALLQRLGVTQADIRQKKREHFSLSRTTHERFGLIWRRFQKTIGFGRPEVHRNSAFALLPFAPVTT